MTGPATVPCDPVMSSSIADVKFHPSLLEDSLEKEPNHGPDQAN